MAESAIARGRARVHAARPLARSRPCSLGYAAWPWLTAGPVGSPLGVPASSDLGITDNQKPVVLQSHCYRMVLSVRCKPNPAPATKKSRFVKRLRAALGGDVCVCNTRGSTVEARGREVLRSAEKTVPSSLNPTAAFMPAEALGTNL